MKHIFKNEIKHLLNGGTIKGLSIDSFMFFLDNLSGKTTCKKVLILAEEPVLSHFARQRGFFKNKLYYFPKQQKNDVVPGFETQQNRHKAETLVGITEQGFGVCLSTEKTAKEKTINKKTALRSLKIKKGLVVDRDVFCETLFSYGYKKSNYTYSPGEYSLRGDIVDIFPEHKNNPIRVVFDFGEIESLGFFDVDSQRSFQNLDGFVFYDLLGEPISTGKSLLGFFDWDLAVRAEFVKNEITINAGSETVSLFSQEIQKEPTNKKTLRSFVEKFGPKNCFLFYTNNKRKRKLKNLGFSVMKGFINKTVYLKAKNTYLIPDYNKNKNKYKHKHIINNSLGDTKEGDLLVHVAHGVGLFSGLVVRGPKNHEKEYIKIEYKDGGAVFVPVDKTDLVHKYVNVGGRATLNKLGGRDWEKNISKTKKDIELVSESLIEIYNSRKKPRGFKYNKKSIFDLEIKRSFPFKETRDQKKAIKDVLLDLEQNQPMDRLICGDVGFGKTEVALRAVVRAVSSLRQVVLLCPTTVLSDQHYITAKERLEPLGVSVALLSRFQTKKEQLFVLKGLLSGSINFVVGTHRLLSDDVVVPSLGLLIIDEEHRFGVKNKETIRALKTKVDVLSMSATPIPRTLQQSLLGIRDISRIETPPTTRKPIDTFVEFFSWQRTAQIIEKELLRGGQVYFLHNKVESIKYYAEQIQSFFPNERVDFIHGQQNSKELEKNLLGFFDGDISVLICSTIIESGLDVSNANCIIINDPQNLGLSQLYQIRGRVGRGSRQANCHLFIPKKTKLSEKAHRRLKTIERHTSLGSGYNIATNDLDIRGGGAVFGYKQSGQISKIGLEFYNNLLKRSVAKKTQMLEEERHVDIFFFGKSLIPIYYVLGESDRFSFYTKINKSLNCQILLDIEKELVDRYGKPPKETINYLNLARLKIILKNTFILSLSINQDNVEFVLKAEKVNASFISKALVFENDLIKNRRFKETKRGPSFVVFFDRGFDWYENICKSINLFLV
ncbi:MAG: DEAD/DEAH box helicase [Candidatus Neomarinimicrobiota bacterium]